MRTSCLINIMKANCRGERKGIYAVESYNSTVMEAYFRQALVDGSPVLLEISANMLGLPGQSGKISPAEFIEKVKHAAVEAKFPRDRIFLGVNDLGPSLWKDESDEYALKKACVFISDLVGLGFNKLGIHAGEPIKGNPVDEPLAQEIIIGRETALYQAAEGAAADLPEEEKPLYVINAYPRQEAGRVENQRRVVSRKDVEDAVDWYAQIAAAAGLPKMKKRLLAVRIFLGPGYDSENVIPFDSSLLKEMGGCEYGEYTVVLEAQQTDYQSQTVLNQLLDNHFAFLRVGLELTYSMREALFSLAMMENETMVGKPGVYLSNYIIELDRAMQAVPHHWQKYYTGNGFEQLVARKYSFYDRSRFFLEDKEVRKMKKRLYDNLTAHPVPLTVLRQFMPHQFERVAAGVLENKPKALVMDAVRRVLRRYSRACGWAEIMHD